MLLIFDYFRYEFLHMYIGWIERIKLEERDGTLLSWYSNAYNLHISLSFSFCYLLFSMWWLSISSPFSIFERWWNYDFVMTGEAGRTLGVFGDLLIKKTWIFFSFSFFKKKALILSTKTWLCNLHCDNLVGFLFLKKINWWVVIRD